MYARSRGPGAAPHGTALASIATTVWMSTPSGGPAASVRIDAKRAEVTVSPDRVERDILPALSTAAWEPPLQKLRQRGKGGAVNRCEIHWATLGR
jgi:hypothetical protein